MHMKRINENMNRGIIMEEIYLQRLAERARQDDTLLDKLEEEVRVEVEKYLELEAQEEAQLGDEKI